MRGSPVDSPDGGSRRLTDEVERCNGRGKRNGKNTSSTAKAVPLPLKGKARLCKF